MKQKDSSSFESKMLEQLQTQDQVYKRQKIAHRLMLKIQSQFYRIEAVAQSDCVSSVRYNQLFRAIFITFLSNLLYDNKSIAFVN